MDNTEADNRRLECAVGRAVMNLISESPELRRILIRRLLSVEMDDLPHLERRQHGRHGKRPDDPRSPAE